MTEAAMTNVRLALSHNAIAKQYLSASAHESTAREKHVINGMLNKCKSIEQDMFMAIKEKDRERFREQIFNTDYLQFQNIFIELLKMPQDQRDALEEVVTRINKGESFQIIE